MKKIISMLFLLGCLVNMNAQDVITMLNGEKINVKVTSITDNNIVYKKTDSATEPYYTVAKRNVEKIVYENGTTEIFNRPEQMGLNQNRRGYNPNPIIEGMTYKEMKEIYEPYYYTKDISDPYKPWLMGGCSLFIPGLGQVLEGETTTGLLMFGANVGINLISRSLGEVKYNSYTGQDELVFKSNGEQRFALLLAVGSIALNIWSVVDASKTAKIKNMYYQDLKKSRNTTFSMHPSIDFTPSPLGLTPSTGLTVSLGF